MKRAIQGLLALTLAIVVACGFQAKPAHAQLVCSWTVSSTNPCIVNITHTGQNYVRISTGEVLLAVYTNNSFSNDVTVTISDPAGDQKQNITLKPQESVWKQYPFQNSKGVLLTASTAGAYINATVVLVQADSQQQ